MAGYGYAYRGGYGTNNGLAPPTDGWSKTSYSTDHTCQPVIIDAEGRRKQIVSYTPTGGSECYVLKTEIVEHVPFVTGYKQSSPVRFEVISDYSDVEGKWNRPSSPEKWRKSSSPVRYHTEEKWHRPSSPVRYHVEDVEKKWHRPSSPVRYHVEDVEKKWHRPSSPVRYHVEEKWNKPSSPVRDHMQPQEVQDFLTKIQTAASQPRKFGPLSAWRQQPTSYQVNTGYGDQGDLSNKPNGYGTRNENYDVPYKRDNILESTGITGSGWAKPSHGANNLESTGIAGSGWAKPSHGAWSKGQGANLSEPTSDINTAMKYLKEAVKLPTDNTPPPSKYTIKVSTAPKKEGDLSNKESLKPSGNTIRKENSDGPYKIDNSMEPTVTPGAGNGWAKPSYGAWSTSQGANLSKPTSDINTKEAVKPPPSRYTIPASTGPKKDAYSGTIDSTEAEKKYGNLNPASYPMTDHNTRRTIDSTEAQRKYGNVYPASRPVDNYTRTIDSREAARKYGGTTV